MDKYAMYLRKSRFDPDLKELKKPDEIDRRVTETLERHEAILKKLARERGYHVAKTYREVVSGETIAARPEIQKLLEEVNAGMYAGVLVVEVERLARGDSADQAYISRIFQFSNTKIITPAKIYDPNNEFDEEYFEFGLFMSRREYKTITRRLVRERAASASEGKYLGSVAPYGYRRVKLEREKGYTLAPDPQEAPVVKRIFALYLPAGAVTSNIEDMLRYAQMQLDADAPFAQCHHSLKVINASSESYQIMGIHMDEIGMAWIIDRENEIVWHNGGTGHYNCYLGFCPDKGIAVVILSNLSPNDRIPSTVLGIKRLIELKNESEI